MQSYTELRNLYGIETKDNSSSNLSYGDQIMNNFYKSLLSKADWPFLHRLRTAKTVASTSFVALPYDTDLVESVFVTVSSTRHTPKVAPSRKFWDQLHYSTYNSDIPEYWFVYDGKIGLWPQPSTSDNVISLSVKVRVPDLNVDNYTTGTITTATNDDETIVGSSTVWTSPMTGRWLRITNDDGVDSGDGLWYEIASVTNNTNLELVRKYGGASISAGTQIYTIGNMPLLPEAYHELPVQYAAYRYWSKENDARADRFKLEVRESVNDLLTSYGMNDLSMVIDDGEGEDFIINPNLLVTL
jgi:hypothetical protein